MEFITKEDFLTEQSEDEVFAVIEEFLYIANVRGLFHINNAIKDNIVILDKDKFEIIQKMIKENTK